ncbi:hypothetical protein [Pseudoalteromonas maricaloris]|uniref:hypothetical protein n=1 Tax=Pseudoalteromonas maricaloris TaxID=184924 RepID=UPI003C1FB863
MAKITIAANSARSVSTAARWLSIINASDTFAIECNAFTDVVGAVGRQYDLEDISTVTFINESDELLHIEYEVANLRITSTASNNVKITNALTIARVLDTLNVRAVNVSATRFNSLDDIIIEPHSRKRLVVDDELRHELIIKNISVHNETVRVGGSDCGATNGLPVVKGGTLALTNGAEIYAYNTGDSQAKLSIVEVLQ